MKTLTIKKLLSFGPCGNYNTEEKILMVTGGRRELTAQEISELHITIDDRVWALIIMLRADNMVVFAQGCADRAQGYATTYAATNATAAARATYAATYAASTAAAVAYADSAAVNVKRATEREKQIGHLLELIEGEQ